MWYWITHPSGYGRNVIIFGADLSSSTHANNKTESILVLGKDFIQGTDGTTIYPENEIVPYPLGLGNISKDFDLGYMEKTGLTGYVYDFSVDYRAIANDKILDIHKYLMEKKQYNMKCLDLLKNVFLQQ